MDSVIQTLKGCGCPYKGGDPPMCLVEVRKTPTQQFGVYILGNDHTWTRKLLHEALSSEYSTVEAALCS